MKKIIKFISSLKPIVLLFAATTIFFILSLYLKNDFSIFDSLTTLFALCIIVTIPSLIDSFLSNYTKKSAWFIILIIIFPFIYSARFFPSDGLLSDIIFLFFVITLSSFCLYLLLPPFMGIFNLIKKIKWKFVQKFVAYIERLLNPIYLFPIKLVTYSTYYLVKFSIIAIVELIKIIIDLVKFPFKSFRNFLKSLFIGALIVYIVASTFVVIDYIRTHYGYYTKFFCSTGTTEKMKKSVVRIVGGYAEGTGFFISENQVLTNFHVIDGESSPKIIFPDGKFITPTKITGDKDADLALLYTENSYPNMVMKLPSDDLTFKEEEPLIATGFAMGTDLVGKATSLRGNFIDYRKSKSSTVGYIQTNISLVEGMSGGPLVDQCGNIAGINTMGLAGLSMFISGGDANKLIPEFTDQEIEKIKVDPSKSPEEAVKAFYIYLKARKMEDGFNLLSQEYLQKTNFEEWTTRFKDILDVEIIKASKAENTDDTVSVKFGTKNWVDGEVEYHLYEGTWKTIFEDGVYKMLKSNIKEVKNPDYLWFYE